MFSFVKFVNNKSMSEIIKFEDFKKRKTLTDDDIKSLFLGLVKLIKNSAIDDVSSKIKEEYKKNAIKLDNITLELKVKNELIADLKKENEILKSKTNRLINKIEILKKRQEEKKFD